MFEFDKGGGHQGENGDSSQGPLSWLSEGERRAVRKDISRVFQVRFDDAEMVI